MKYIKTYELSVYDQVRPYLIDKYVVIAPKFDMRRYLLEITEEMIEGRIRAKKLYTLNPDNKIRKNKHQFYNPKPDDLEWLVIYKSSNLKDAYDVLASIHDSNKYNL